MRKIAAFILLLPAFAQATLYTMSQNGSASASSTFGGAGVPGPGDQIATGNFALTFPSGYTSAVGTCQATAPGTPDIEVGGTGKLIFATGSNAILRGLIRYDGTIGDDTHFSDFTVQTGARVSTDCSTAYNTRLQPQVYQHFTRLTIGTAGDPYNASSSTIVTSTGSAPILLWDEAGTNFSNLSLDINGAVISYCGTATQNCIDADIAGSGTYVSHLKLNNVYADHVGGLLKNPGFRGDNDLAADWSVTNTISVSPLQFGDIFTTNSCGTTTGIRLIANNVLGLAWNSTNGAFLCRYTIYNNVGIVYLPIAHLSAAQKWTFHDNVALIPNVNQSFGYFAIEGDVRRSYVVMQGASPAGNGTILNILNQAGTDWVVDDIVFDNQTTQTISGGGNHCGSFAGIGATLAGNFTFTHALILWGLNGTQSCQFAQWNLNLSSATGWQKYQHVTQPGGLIGAGGVSLGTTGLGGMFVNEGATIVTPVADIRPNAIVYFDETVRTGSGGVSPNVLTNSQPGTTTANQVPPAAIGHNWNYNFTPVTRWPGSNGNCTSLANGTAVDGCFTGVTPPGRGDINGQSPMFPACGPATRRGIDTWAVTQGQAQSVAGAQAAFAAAGPARLGAMIQSLRLYVKEGCVMGNPLGWNAGQVWNGTAFVPDNEDIGAVPARMFPMGIGLRRIPVQ